jgi:hypothetical protein
MQTMTKKELTKTVSEGTDFKTKIISKDKGLFIMIR